MAEVKYQIFVSSTYLDLRPERQEALQTILELNHIPAGMELFPGGDSNIWRTIEEVIKASDYYVVIIGKRYGSVNDEGISYTEREFNLAQKLEIPIIPILYEGAIDPNSPEEKESQVKLDAFRKRISELTPAYAQNANQLGRKLMQGIHAASIKYARPGYVRADKFRSVLEENKTLKAKLTSVQTQVGPRVRLVEAKDRKAVKLSTKRTEVEEPAPQKQSESLGPNPLLAMLAQAAQNPDSVPKIKRVIESTTGTISFSLANEGTEPARNIVVWVDLPVGITTVSKHPAMRVWKFLPRELNKPCKLELKIPALRHKVETVALQLYVVVPNNKGTYEIKWTCYADNQAEPQRGSLLVEVDRG